MQSWECVALVFCTMTVMPSIYICPFLFILSFPQLLMNHFRSSSLLDCHDCFLYSSYSPHLILPILHTLFSKLPQMHCLQTLAGLSLLAVKFNLAEHWNAPTCLVSFMLPVALHPMLQPNPSSCSLHLCSHFFWVWEALSSFCCPKSYLSLEPGLTWTCSWSHLWFYHALQLRRKLVSLFLMLPLFFFCKMNMPLCALKHSYSRAGLFQPQAYKTVRIETSISSKYQAGHIVTDELISIASPDL